MDSFTPHKQLANIPLSKAMTLRPQEANLPKINNQQVTGLRQKATKSGSRQTALHNDYAKCL